MKTCARGLMFALQEVDSTNFNLWSAYHARNEIVQAHKNLINSPFTQTFANWRVQCTTLDIKDMYSALPHLEIRKSISWCCDLFRKTTRRDRCNVHRRGKAEGRKGRSYNTALRRDVLMTDIILLTELLLQEAYFQAGDMITLQTSGIPMGCPTSPALAIAVCIRAEHVYVQSLQSIQRPLAGLRYFDDILLWTLAGTDHNGRVHPTEERKAAALLQSAQRIYHPALRLIPQPCDKNRFSFLETTIAFRQDASVEIDYQNKNTATLLEEVPHQRIQRFRHGNSSSPRSSLRSVVGCMLGRATQFSTRPMKWIQSIVMLIQEFILLRYPVKIIQDAIHRLARRHPLGQAWRVISDIITDAVQ